MLRARMPETAINKHSYANLIENKIWTAIYRGIPSPTMKATRPQYVNEGQFGRSVPGPLYLGHNPRTSSFANVVHSIMASK